MTEPELSNADVVLYALFKLGGDERKIHTEEIAYEAHSLAKERFAWRLSRFRDMGFPDKEPVRRALMDAAKEKYGHLAEGRADVHAKGKETDGWALTPEGVTWIRENEKRITSTLGTTRAGMPFVDALRSKVRMHEQPLFRRFLEKEKLEGQNLYNFTDMLNTSPGAPKEEIALRFRRLHSTAQLVASADNQFSRRLCPSLLHRCLLLRQRRAKGLNRIQLTTCFCRRTPFTGPPSCARPPGCGRISGLFCPSKVSRIRIATTESVSLCTRMKS